MTAAQEGSAVTKQEIALIKEEMTRTKEAMAVAQEEAVMANEDITSMKEVSHRIESLMVIAKSFGNSH